MNVWLNSRPLRAIGIVATAFLVACFAISFLNLLTPPRPLVALQPTRPPTRRPPPTITPVAYPPTANAVLHDDFTSRANFPRANGVKVPFAYTATGFDLTPPLDPGFAYVLNQT